MFTEDIDALRELKAEFRSQERWTEFAQVLERWISSVDDADRRRLLQDELVETYEFMLQLEDASAVTEAELKLDEIYRSRRTPEAYQALANLYLDCAERNADDIEAYVAARRACAAVFENELNQPDGALLILLTALGSDVLKQPGMVDEIERLASRTAAWTDAAKAVESVLDYQVRDADWSALEVRVGDWWSHVDRDAARRCYELAFEHDPTDLEAIARLEKIFDDAMDVGGRARLLRARGEAVHDPQEKAELLCAAAGLYEQLMGHATQAIDCYERALTVSPGTCAFEALERLYSAAQQWEELVRVLRVQESLTNDIDQLAQLQHRIADVFARAGEVDEAIQQFRDASASPKAYIAALKREADAVDSEHNRGRFLAEVGNVYARELGDSLSAHHYYQKALSIDSQIVDAAEPLADVYIEEGRWDKAAPLLDAILRNATSDRAPSWRHMRYLQFARACQRTGRPAEALEAFRNAYEANPRDVATLKGFGKALIDAQAWDKAFRILAALLEHRQALDPQSLTAMFYMRGLCLENLSDMDRAVVEYEEAVRLNPSHRDALQKLTDYYERSANWAKFVDYANNLIQVEPEPLVRFRQFVRLGEVWANQLNRPDLAMVAYRGAIDIDPNSLVVLRRLLDIYTKQSKFALAVKVIERLLAQESNPKRTANLHYTAGVIYRDHVSNGPEAVRHFEAALDSDPEMLKAFEAVDRVLTQAREWKELERSYRRMLKRISTAPDPQDVAHIERLLWEGLAEIYRTRLGDFENAIEAYEALRRRKPDDDRFTLILSELYERAGNAEGAIREHRRLIQNAPRRIESYHELYKAYTAIGNWDAAWCLSGALSFMRCANAHEESFYQKYLGRNLKLAHGVVTPDLLRFLYHPDEDILTSMILSYVSESLRPIYGNTLKGLGINTKKQAINADAKGVFRRIYDYVSKTLGNPAAPVLFGSDRPDGLKNLNAEWPAVLAGADRLGSSNDRENAFIVGKLLCGMRPDHYLATAGFSSQGINTLFMAALEAMEPSLKVSKQIKDANFTRAVKDLRKLPDAARVQLMKVVQQFLQRGKPVDIEAWLVAVDHTTSRFGLLICGDLALAGATVRYGPLQMGPGDDEDKLKELTLFSVSEAHFQLRAALRLSISDTSSPW